MALTQQEMTRFLLSARKLALLRMGRSVRVSHYGEQGLIERQVATLPPELRVCVDIGASDGVSGSNTLPLFRAGWAGLAVEMDGPAFGLLAAGAGAPPRRRREPLAGHARERGLTTVRPRIPA